MANKTGYIDIHHHIIPEFYLDALKEAGIDKAGGLKINNWQPENSIKMMDRLGIEVGITSISDPVVEPLEPSKRKAIAREINLLQKQIIKEYPNRFGAFATLPLPDVDSAIEEVKYALDNLQLDGVGLLSNYNEVFLGDPQFEPLMKVLDERATVVFIHPSTPPDYVPRPKYMPVDFIAEFTFNTTRAAANLILSGTMDRYPNIKFILAHADGTLPYLTWRINECYKLIKQTADESQFVVLAKDPEAYVSDFYYDTALSTQSATFRALEETTLEDHILFGSDAHYAPENLDQSMINTIKHQLDLKNETIENIKYNSALKLFPRFQK
ncbi:TPA: amidohydrolase family protein [Staphylococcus aureus]|nr:amidohydrolase family protein [Staphylococcus aureus]HCZ7648633.1 amidohydrolase family protein [Staphylococcus aureus]HDA1664498.1 amidohydrolase family protein [Staphylococcus aureus]